MRDLIGFLCVSHRGSLRDGLHPDGSRCGSVSTRKGTLRERLGNSDFSRVSRPSNAHPLYTLSDRCQIYSLPCSICEHPHSRAPRPKPCPEPCPLLVMYSVSECARRLRSRIRLLGTVPTSVRKQVLQVDPFVVGDVSEILHGS